MEKTKLDNKAWKPEKKVEKDKKSKENKHDMIDGKINVNRYMQKHSLSLSEALKEIAKLEENED